MENVENVEMENATIVDEKDMGQRVVTSNENESQELTKLTSGNDVGTSNVESIASKFGAIYESSAILEPHAYANIYPNSTQAEYERLIEDIKVHGQFDAAIIFEGKIADGRTRQKALQELKQPLLVREWLGTPEGLLNYLYSKTQHRNLNSQQKAVISLQFLKEEKELAKQRRGMRTDLYEIVEAVKGRASEITAKRNGTNRTYLDYAKKIQDQAEELLEYVKNNEIPIGQAKLLAESINNPEQRVEAAEKYKEGKQTMKAIISDIKFKDNPAHDVSKPNDNNKIPNVIPALMLFQHMNLSQEKEIATEKIRQIAEILNIDTREIWYIPDTEEKTNKKILKLLQDFAKKIEIINKFSSDGNAV